MSADTVRNDHGFERVRSEYHAGSGIGRIFLSRFIHQGGKVSNHDINEIKVRWFNFYASMHSR